MVVPSNSHVDLIKEVRYRRLNDLVEVNGLNGLIGLNGLNGLAKVNGSNGSNGLIQAICNTAKHSRDIRDI